jgi:hypothetical protein
VNRGPGKAALVEAVEVLIIMVMGEAGEATVEEARDPTVEVEAEVEADHILAEVMFSMEIIQPVTDQ